MAKMVKRSGKCVRNKKGQQTEIKMDCQRGHKTAQIWKMMSVQMEGQSSQARKLDFQRGLKIFFNRPIFCQRTPVSFLRSLIPHQAINEPAEDSRACQLTLK